MWKNKDIFAVVLKGLFNLNLKLSLKKIVSLGFGFEQPLLRGGRHGKEIQLKQNESRNNTGAEYNSIFMD